MDLYHPANTEDITMESEHTTALIGHAEQINLLKLQMFTILILMTLQFLCIIPWSEYSMKNRIDRLEKTLQKRRRV